MKRLLFTVLAALVPAAAQAAPVAMTAMRAEGGIEKPVVMPRLAKFPDAKVMAKVNAALAAQQASDRSGATDCVGLLKDAGQKPGPDSYAVRINVSYMSAKYLSVVDDVNYDCAGAHPDHTQTVLNFDLATGASVDLMAAFRPDFNFERVYAARYRMPKRKDDDADCRSWSTGDAGGLGEFRPRLDSTVGLVVGLETAHVVAACADDLELSLADLQKFLKDTALLADLTANVKPRKWRYSAGLGIAAAPGFGRFTNRINTLMSTMVAA